MGLKKEFKNKEFTNNKEYEQEKIFEMEKNGLRIVILIQSVLLNHSTLKAPPEMGDVFDNFRVTCCRLGIVRTGGKG